LDAIPDANPPNNMRVGAEAERKRKRARKARRCQKKAEAELIRQEELRAANDKSDDEESEEEQKEDENKESKESKEEEKDDENEESEESAQEEKEDGDEESEESNEEKREDGDDDDEDSGLDENETRETLLEEAEDHMFKYELLGIVLGSAAQEQFEQDWLRREEPEAPANRTGVPTGNFRDLFDRVGTLFDVTPGLRGYRLLDEATRVFLQFQPGENGLRRREQRSQHMLEQLKDKEAGVTRGVAKVAATDLWNCQRGTGLSKFVTRLLLTRCVWSNTITYRALLINFYVQLHSAFKAIKLWSLVVESNDEVRKVGKWVNQVSHFVNGFAATLCQVLTYGPNNSEKEPLATVMGQFDSPLFTVLCVPVLKMAKKFFPNDFDVTKVMKKTVHQLVKNIKERGMKFGVYGLKHLDCKVWEGNADKNNFKFLLGVYCPFYRLTVINNKAVAMKEHNLLVNVNRGKKVCMMTTSSYHRQRAIDVAGSGVFPCYYQLGKRTQGLLGRAFVGGKADQDCCGGGIQRIRRMGCGRKNRGGWFGWFG
jgi:hypothetical protein